MLTTIEKLIEAIIFAEEEECSWVKYFESPEEALSILQDARDIKIGDIEEYQLVELTERLSVDPYEIAYEIAYEECLSILEEDLNESEYSI